MPLPIEDYAVLGDTGTAALVGRDGSVDWLCLPRFDSPACFAALLGGPEHGRWLLGAPDPSASSSRRYVDNSAVLETTYTTDTGRVVVLDLMPVGDNRADLVRRVIGVEGTVRMRHEWVVRLGYGKIRRGCGGRTCSGCGGSPRAPGRTGRFCSGPRRPPPRAGGTWAGSA